MGRFASTVPYYRRCRPPYPPEFFQRCARALQLNGSQALIDLGCGPGLLALGFAPYVRRVAGADPEPAMIAAARRAAAASAVALELLAARVEDLPAGLGPFEVVTIGRALHWMTPAPTLARLDRLVAARGAILVCGSSSAEGPVNPWLAGFEELRRRVSPEQDRSRYRTEAAGFFSGSAFALRETVSVRFRQSISVDTLVGRMFSMSNTSPELLGARADPVAAELRAVLAPYAVAGQTIEEVVEAEAAILVRAQSAMRA
jgi:SAM-dependent methyltransferase